MCRVRSYAFPLVVFLALVLARTATAETEARPRAMALEVGLFGGIFMPDEHHEFYDPTLVEQQPLKEVNPDVGLHIGFFPLSFLGLEGEASASFSETEDNNPANLYSARVGLVLQIPLRVTPFILGGVGYGWLRSGPAALGDDRDRVWHGAGGLKIFATPRLLFRLEGRIYYSNQERSSTDPTNDNGMVAHFGALGGVSWLFGGRSQQPDPDPDKDGFLGPADMCPQEKGVAPDGCPARDTDGDGLVDASDRCPTEPETVNGFEDTDGCPDDLPDPDRDQIRGEADKCPDQPEDKDGFEDQDGCPEADNDKDGIADASDACAEQSGPSENHGCPDSDRDGDGVVDRLDNCPSETGRAEFQGCRSKQLVSITPSQLKVFKKIQFSSGRATVASRSRPVLDNMAMVIRAHPEFTMIRIEGHTDDKGSDTTNKMLSQERAQAVVDYLVGKGVEPARLHAIGFGKERPLASNQTSSGRRKNRRVEFNLEEVRLPGSKPASLTPAAPGSPGGTETKSAPAAPGSPGGGEAKPPEEEKPAGPKKEGGPGGGGR